MHWEYDDDYAEGKLDIDFALFCDQVRAEIDDQHGPDEPGHFQVAKAAKAFEIWRVEQ
jgi:hypothetical protein